MDKVCERYSVFGTLITSSLLGYFFISSAQLDLRIFSSADLQMCSNLGRLDRKHLRMSSSDYTPFQQDSK